MTCSEKGLFSTSCPNACCMEYVVLRVVKIVLLIRK